MAGITTMHGGLRVQGLKTLYQTLLSRLAGAGVGWWFLGGKIRDGSIGVTARSAILRRPSFLLKYLLAQRFTWPGFDLDFSNEKPRGMSPKSGIDFKITSALSLKTNLWIVDADKAEESRLSHCVSFFALHKFSLVRY